MMKFKRLLNKLNKEKNGQNITFEEFVEIDQIGQNLEYLFLIFFEEKLILKILAHIERNQATLKKENYHHVINSIDLILNV